jgi:hypothetical protein
MCYHLVNSCRAAEKHAVLSVSLSEWLGWQKQIDNPSMKDNIVRLFCYLEIMDCNTQAMTDDIEVMKDNSKRK